MSTKTVSPLLLEGAVTAPGHPKGESPASSEQSAVRRLLESGVVVNVLRLALIAAVLAMWQIAANQDWIDPRLYGDPKGVWEALKEYIGSDGMWTNTAATLKAVLVAFVIGSGLGIAAGLLIGGNHYLDRLVAPLLVPINTIPRIALAPLFVAWFGLTMTAKVVLAASIVFFILLENSRSAVKAIDPDLSTMAKVAGLRPLQMVWKVILPSAVPTIFAGLRLGITYSLLGVIASEMVASRDGLGQLIVTYSSTLQTNLVWAVLIELIIIATIIAVLFEMIERWLLRWQA